MAPRININAAEERLMEALIGGSMGGISYFVTGWEFRIVMPQDGAPDWCFYACRAEVPENDLSFNELKHLKINLKDTNEASDTLVAMVVFTVLNKWPINQLKIDKNCDLELGFENNAKLRFSGNPETGGYSWEVKSNESPFIVTCDAAELYGTIKF